LQLLPADDRRLSLRLLLWLVYAACIIWEMLKNRRILLPDLLLASRCSIQQVQRHMCTVTTTGPAYLFAPDATNTMNETLESKEV